MGSSSSGARGIGQAHARLVDDLSYEELELTSALLLPPRAAMQNQHAPSVIRKQPRIGPYQIVATIATGGISVVYRALDTSQHRETALKVMLPELTTKPNLLERFRREGRLASKLQHEHIVR